MSRDLSKLLRSASPSYASKVLQYLSKQTSSVYQLVFHYRPSSFFTRRGVLGNLIRKVTCEKIKRRKFFLRGYSGLAVPPASPSLCQQQSREARFTGWTTSLKLKSLRSRPMGWNFAVSKNRIFYLYVRTLYGEEVS